MIRYSLYSCLFSHCEGTVVVEAELEDGTVGIGTSVGGEPACYIIENHLSRFVEGQDPRNVELMWDQVLFLLYHPLCDTNDFIIVHLCSWGTDVESNNSLRSKRSDHSCHQCSGLSNLGSLRKNSK